VILSAMRAAVLLLACAGAAGVVRARDPFAQAIAVSAYGIVLSVMFVLYQAPDVALSQIVVGAVALPLMIVLSLAKIRRDEEGKR
jgi:energy-converting hydrogenase B subunit D